MHDPPRFDDTRPEQMGRVLGPSEEPPPLPPAIDAAVVALRALAVAMTTPLSGVLDQRRNDAVAALIALHAALTLRITRYDAADQRSRLRSCFETVTPEWLEEKAAGWEAFRKTVLPRPESTPALRARVRHLARLCEGVATVAMRVELEVAEAELVHRDQAVARDPDGHMGATGSE